MILGRKPTIYLLQRQRIILRSFVTTPFSTAVDTRTTMTTTTCTPIRFTVHSTFRDWDGNLLKPKGLEWDMNGDSHVSYVALGTQPGNSIDLEAKETQEAIIQAHNRWAFAREEEPKQLQDISRVIREDDGYHFRVEWNSSTTTTPFKETRYENILELLEKDPAAKDNMVPPVPVWVNGLLLGVLSPKRLSAIQDAVSKAIKFSDKLSYKRNSSMIRIERFFTGGLRKKNQIFDHILDNLIALEDPQNLILGEDDSHSTLRIIGTASLSDWIMGGRLTSRLWVQQGNRDNKNILFLRPLRNNDDLNSSDRRFELVEGVDDEMIQLVQEQLERLVYLASLKHPFESSNHNLKNSSEKNEDPLVAIRQKMKMNRRRNNFGF